MRFKGSIYPIIVTDESGIGWGPPPLTLNWTFDIYTDGETFPFSKRPIYSDKKTAQEECKKILQQFQEENIEYTEVNIIGKS